MDSLTTSVTPPDKPVFLVTIDTEEEWDWSGPLPSAPFSTQNIEQIPEFQTLCKDLGVVPTYFVDQAVVDNKHHVALINQYLQLNECDVGAHLHPWCTPPITEAICDHNSHSINLPLELFEEKIKYLTDALHSAFGRHPYSYRAGRWGINGPQLRILAAAGYQVDSTVRPFYEDNNFSYLHAPTAPYWPSFDDCLEPDDTQRAILEIPVSSGFNRANFGRCQALHEKLCAPPLNRLRLIGILWHLGFLRKITVTPEGHDSKDICQCIDRCIERGETVINIFFHSSDLLPKCTPYVKDASDKQRFLNRLRESVSHLQRVHKAECITMRDIRPLLTRAS